MLLTHYWKAFQGYSIWSRIDRKYCAPVYILMPKEKDEYNYYALLHLEQFLQGKGLREAVVLTCDDEAIAALSLFVSECTVKTAYISRDDALKLMKYYALHEFTQRLAIVSLTEPYDTHAENLLGLHGVDKEELVCFDVYRLHRKPEVSPPRYVGTDGKAMAFLDRVKKGAGN